MEHMLRNKLHRRGMARYPTDVMKRMLRACLDDPEKCELRQSVIAMDNMLYTAEQSQDNALSKRNYADAIKSLTDSNAFFPTIFKPDNFNNMYARHGRRFGKQFLEYKKANTAGDKKDSRRVKRSNSGPLSALLRNFVKTCIHSECESTTSAPRERLGDY